MARRPDTRQFSPGDCGEAAALRSPADRLALSEHREMESGHG